jgi:hypothetical protein
VAPYGLGKQKNFCQYQANKGQAYIPDPPKAEHPGFDDLCKLGESKSWFVADSDHSWIDSLDMHLCWLSKSPTFNNWKTY